MRLEGHGPQQIMEGLRLTLQDQLEQAGYQKGPKVDTMNSGLLITFLKNDTIISVQVTEETETQESFLSVECEQDLQEIRELWDLTLIQYGKDCIARIVDFAINKEKVRQGLK